MKQLNALWILIILLTGSTVYAKKSTSTSLILPDNPMTKKNSRDKNKLPPNPTLSITTGD